ncbi:class I SAM-dependent methyltransferase [Oligosphaera ethanolica]|uniref:Ubiquinone/menaquinone biosynthesis C-methylase UbiE n=1 Tax=Oligosphaera ethanolica TaxID=760260 RepID=A0AAE4AMW3_9BACT|nr:class I SAM-dependent methyltransferase [Oligosphaera ethanolica]MDQ0288896.1 ubiquinone/menaquinone biosynthesis C-methylase UbiE [Oligosphaera ethanolica]
MAVRLPTILLSPCAYLVYVGDDVVATSAVSYFQLKPTYHNHNGLYRRFAPNHHHDQKSNAMSKPAQSDVFSQEEQFHDDWAKTIHSDDIDVDTFFTCPSCVENKLIADWLGDVHGKKILELGCGAGEASVFLAKRGGDVTATDISGEMLKVADELARNNGVTIATSKCLSHALSFPDASFDVVYCANLLHHVDIDATLAEVRRVLKTGGIFVAWEPLAHNPVINVYRRMADKVRTADEHPLTMAQIKTLSRYFSSIQTQMTWFFTLAVFLKFYFVDHVHPNDERYWKKIVYDFPRFAGLYLFLEKADRIFLRCLPFMRRYCWNVVLLCKK